MSSELTIPKTITILGHKYRLEKSPGMENFGETLGPDRVIRINTIEIDTVEKLSIILIHEILHAGLYVTGQDEILEKYDDTGHLEEALVQSLAHVIAPLVTLKCLEE
jgi:hypothetical protein